VRDGKPQALMSRRAGQSLQNLGRDPRFCVVPIEFGGSSI
jgi:hypothetical protein